MTKPSLVVFDPSALSASSDAQTGSPVIAAPANATGPQLETRLAVQVVDGRATDRSSVRSGLDQPVLPDHEQILDAAVESLTDGFLLLDFDLRILFVNDLAERILRADRNELVGRPLPELLWRPEWRTLATTLDEVVTQGKSRKVRIHEPGSERIWQIKAFPSESGVVVFMRDVSAERQAEGWTRLLETAVDRINDLVMVCDAQPLTDVDGPRVVYVNAAYARISGFHRDEVIGEIPFFLRDVENSKDGARLIAQAVHSGQPCRAEIQCQSRTGDDLWLEIDLVPLFDNSGTLTNWVSIKRDITERRRIEHRLRQMHRLESVAGLTGNLAHDFNNLLSVVIGNAEALSEMLEGEPEKQRLAELSLSAAERGAALTARLLAFGRRQQLSARLSDANTLLHGWREQMRRVLRPRIALDLSLDADLWMASLDHESLEDSLLELISNARDAITGSGCITITTANLTIDRSKRADWPDAAAGRYVSISVTDDGAGMAPETSARAIEPFFSTKKSASASGLGLSSLFGFVHQSGGDARIVSAMGLGTTVTLIFPAAISAGETISSSPRINASLATASRDINTRNENHRLKLLVVEDDPMLRENLVRQFKKRGHTVIAAEDGPQALGILAGKTPFDLLISDVRMPGSIDGVALAAAARRMRKGLKVLLVSGYTDHPISQDAVSDPDLAFVGKPYRFVTLLQSIQELMSPNAPSARGQISN